jgi:adenylate cyclase
VSRWQLLPLDGGAPIALPSGRAVVLGRGGACDIHLSDDTVSRQHAELRGEERGITVRDLGSANGTAINGVRVAEGRVGPNDVIDFGSSAFRVMDASPHAAESPAAAEEEVPAGTSVRAVDVGSGGDALGSLQAERLARLVELARHLSGEIEVPRVLAAVVDQAADLLPADRVALLLAEEPGGELRRVLWRNRLGGEPVDVPRSIARRAVEERAPITTENAFLDARFQSGSVVASRVRAALCVPLMADKERVLGALYVDTLTGTVPFSEDDAALCFAFGGLAAVCIAKAHYAEATRRQAITRANFERFFAPGVAARIAGHTSGVRPGGERRAVTVLFSDVRGFIGLAETMAPEAIAEHLSDYFAVMVDVVFDHGGTLDKFIGDALLAFWGAPRAGADDAERAVAAARAMQGELALLNARWTAGGRPALGVGIGLHHGEAFAGTIGSPRRLEYTVIGDVVNVAARLCEAAAAGEILLSEAVRARLATPPPLSGREPLRLRGREEAVVVYQVEGRE